MNLNEIYVNDLELHNYLAQIQIEVDRFAKSHFRNRQKISSLEGKLETLKPRTQYGAKAFKSF